jgi:methylaspartate mutase epsilon subunit
MLEDRMLDEKKFHQIREEVLTTWPSGEGISLQDGFSYQRNQSSDKNFARALSAALKENQVLVQPRAGVALVDEHIALLKFLEEDADLLPTTIDAYTRLNRYDEAQKGIDKSRQAGQSLLNGFPAVNHGLEGCRRVVEGVSKPVQVRHGTPDARLLAEITLAAGFTAYEGGGISYNIPYAKNVALEDSLYYWQYVDRLVGLYEREGVSINREPFGPLSGTLVPPSISHSIAILEGIFALRQGARSITLGYGQAGNLIQDIAAIRSLNMLAEEFFQEENFNGYELSTVFHQWMGGFPEDESRAFGVIAWGASAAALAPATKVICKTPHEAMGIPTKEANRQGLRASRQCVKMLKDQRFPDSPDLEREMRIIHDEVRLILKTVKDLGEGDYMEGTVRAFKAGVLDVPFAPAKCNQGKLLPCRDDHGAIRILEHGHVPISDELRSFHKEKLEERGKSEGRDPGFQMVIDDIYAISKGNLVGRPR